MVKKEHNEKPVKRSLNALVVFRKSNEYFFGATHIDEPDC